MRQWLVPIAVGFSCLPCLAAPKPEEGPREFVLFDFETPADLAAGSDLIPPDAEPKEPAAKVEDRPAVWVGHEPKK